MQITIHWQMPIQLTLNRKIIVDENELPEEVEDYPGIYFFSRKFGETKLPFYIGETLTLRSRLKSHLGSRKIADVLRGISADQDIKNGTRYFHYGYLKGNASKPLTKKRLSIVQRHLIRVAIENDIPILNSNLTKLKTHTVVFSGGKETRAIYEKLASVEAT
jgi:hypothetical protein